MFHYHFLQSICFLGRYNTKKPRQINTFSLLLPTRFVHPLSCPKQDKTAKKPDVIYTFGGFYQHVLSYKPQTFGLPPPPPPVEAFGGV
jgi:hypothetical protein